MAEDRVSRAITNKAITLVLVCFFFSGLTGLIYEILWIRMIVKIIGGAPFAVSIILTVFMGGLGLGSYLAGRSIDRVKEPIKLVRIYGLLELGIVRPTGLCFRCCWRPSGRSMRFSITSFLLYFYHTAFLPLSATLPSCSSLLSAWGPHFPSCAGFTLPASPT